MKKFILATLCLSLMGCNEDGHPQEPNGVQVKTPIDVVSIELKTIPELVNGEMPVGTSVSIQAMATYSDGSTKDITDSEELEIIITNASRDVVNYDKIANHLNARKTGQATLSAAFKSGPEKHAYLSDDILIDFTLEKPQRISMVLGGSDCAPEADVCLDESITLRYLAHYGDMTLPLDESKSKVALTAQDASLVTLTGNSLLGKVGGVTTLRATLEQYPNVHIPDMAIKVSDKAVFDGVSYFSDIGMNYLTSKVKYPNGSMDIDDYSMKLANGNVTVSSALPETESDIKVIRDKKNDVIGFTGISKGYEQDRGRSIDAIYYNVYKKSSIAQSIPKDITKMSGFIYMGATKESTTLRGVQMTFMLSDGFITDVTAMPRYSHFKLAPEKPGKFEVVDGKFSIKMYLHTNNGKSHHGYLEGVVLKVDDGIAIQGILKQKGISDTEAGSNYDVFKIDTVMDRL